VNPLELLQALVLEDGRLWGDVAADFQLADAEAIFAADGPRWHYLTRPRGGSKTTDLAGCGLAWLAAEAAPAARGYVFAGDKDQAGLLADAAAGFVDRTPELRGVVEVQAFKLIGRNGATVEVRAADGGGAFGLRPAFCVVDEYALWEDVRRLRRVWTAIVSGAGKVPGARLVVLTSAGEPNHWSYKVLETARRSGAWRVSEVPGPLSWADSANLEAQRPLLMPSEFDRLHLNRWTAAEDRLVSAEDLLACSGHEGALDPVPGMRYVAGLDLGLKNDRTVLSVCHAEALPTGRKIVLDRQTVWAGSRLRPVDLGEVEATCIHVHQTYAGCSFVFDPWQSAQLAQNLRRRRIKVTDFTFGQQSVGRLAQRLYNLLAEHALDLPGDDADLLAELALVKIRETSPGVFRMDHDAGQHDDRAISLALAASHLLEFVPRPRPRLTMGGHPRGPDGRVIVERATQPMNVEHIDTSGLMNWPPPPPGARVRVSPAREQVAAPAAPVIGMDERHNANQGPPPPPEEMAAIERFMDGLRPRRRRRER